MNIDKKDTIENVLVKKNDEIKRLRECLKREIAFETSAKKLVKDATIQYHKWWTEAKKAVKEKQHFKKRFEKQLKVNKKQALKILKLKLKLKKRKK